MRSARFRFEIVEDLASADFIFDAYGQTLEDLFKACATACFTAMTEIEPVEPIKEYNLMVDGEDLNELLYNYIAELIYLKDTEKSFFSYFEIHIAEDKKSLSSVVRGEPIDYDKHVIKTDVKAVTYHDLNITERNGEYVTRMVLDL
jgi:SHS2 domain-containing protein